MIRNRAFTTLELIVALLLLAIFTAIAAPNFTATMDSFQKNALLHQLMADLSEARAKSLAEGSKVIITSSQAGTAYTIGIDNLPYNANSSYDQLINTRKLDRGNSLNFADQIVFSSRGYLIDEFGDPSNVTIELYRDNKKFCSGTLYTVGAFEYDCSL